MTVLNARVYSVYAGRCTSCPAGMAQLCFVQLRSLYVNMYYGLEG